MAGMPMCRDHTCPQREKCYRYRKFPLPKQTYLTPNRSEHGCSDFRSIWFYAPVREMEKIK